MGRPHVLIDLHEPRSSVSTPAAARFSPLVSAIPPSATTASVASALSRWPFLEKFIRTPAGVFSNDSMAPKFSRTGCVWVAGVFTHDSLSRFLLLSGSQDGRLVN